ncbi:OmpA family protein [Pseudoalteromonas sp. SSM20]|uniref:OmpA family protein n=1 Tax=Pseudoalteromonas sp. SSM20 TaxID=3139394 RepID=UPI003BAD5A28
MKTLITKGKLSVVTLFLTSLNTPILFANQNQFEHDFFYAGAKFGSIRYQHGCEPWAIGCDKRDTAFAGFFGYQLNDELFIESSLIDLGEVNATYFESGLFVPYQGEMNAWDITVGYDLTLTDNFKAFTKIGVVNWYGKNSSPSFEIKDDGFAATASVGFKYDIADKWQARIAYQYIDDLGSNKLGSSNGHIGWLGISYLFKNSKPIKAAEPAPVIKEKPQERIIPAITTKKVVIKPQTTTVLFDFDSTAFHKHSDFINLIQHLKQYPTTSVEITAYTDSLGSEQYNLALSERRALNVKQTLIEHGIEKSRISINYRGELDPITNNETKENRRLNRRATLVTSEIEVEIAEGTAND